MPAWKLVPQIISKKIRVHIYGLDRPLGKELSSQLGANEKIEMVDENEKYDLIFYLVGFGDTSWSDSLDHTTTLHKYLETTKKNKAKFVLITPEKSNHYLQVAISLVNQFSKNFGLLTKHLMVDNQIPWDESAEIVIRNFIKGYVYSKKSIVTSDVVKKTENKRTEVVVDETSGKKSKGWLWLVLLLLSPWILTAVGWMGMYLSLTCMSRSAEKGSWKTMFSCSAISYRLSQVVQPLTKVSLGSEQVLSYLGIQPFELISFVERLHTVSGQADGLYNQSVKLSAGLFDQTSQVASSDIAQLNQSLAQLLDSLAYLQADLKSLASKPGRLSITVANLENRIGNLRQQINKALLVTADLGKILGIDKPVTLVVVVQDSSEIRATGGFIEGVVIAQVDHGKIGEIQIIDAAQADSMLKGQVEPPEDLQEALQESSWLLRDANWDPDFSQTGKRVAWFIQKELNINPDLVIALNLEALRQTLRIIGPVEIDGLGKVTADNLTEKQTNYYKTQSESGRFTLALLEKILSGLPSVKEKTRQELVDLLSKLLEQRQVFIQPITFTASGLQQANWSGQVVPSVCKSQYPCLFGSIYPVDSNTGLNKVNSYVLREHAITYKIGEDELDGLYKVTYTNASPVGAGWPQGIYKNYLRVLIPGQTVIGDVKVKGQTLATNAYRIDLDRGGVVVGLALSVDPSTSASVEINFKKAVPQVDKFHFQWEFINQPGFWSEPWSVAVEYPPVWLASSQKPYTIASAGLFRYNQLLSSPYRLDIDFVKWKNTP